MRLDDWADEEEEEEEEEGAAVGRVEGPEARTEGSIEMENFNSTLPGMEITRLLR